MKTFLSKLVLPISIFILFSANAAAQKVTVNPFAVQSSTLLEDLKKLKAQNPQMAIGDFVKNANAMLANQGFNYVFAFDAAVCGKIAEAKKNRKDPNSPVRLNAKLSSFEGDITAVVLPESQSEASECGQCYVLLPVFEATAKDFVTVIQNRTVKFNLPANFILNEVALLDSNSPNVVVRKWTVPFRAAPISISEDGTMIFFDLPAAELKDLALIVFENGGLQFYARKDVDPNIKSVTANGGATASIINVDSGEKKKTVKFSQPCK